MLGIDIGPAAVSIVEVRLRADRLIWEQARRFAISPDSRVIEMDPRALTEIVRKCLSEGSWRSRQAVMTLPRHSCFIRRFRQPGSSGLRGSSGSEKHLSPSRAEALLNNVRQSLWAPAEELVFDLWVHRAGKEVPHGADSPAEPPEDVILMGAVRRTAVEFCREVIAGLDIKVQGLSMRPLARINGLLPYWMDEREWHPAVLHIETNEAEMGIIDAEGIVSLQSLNFANGPDGNWENELVGQIQRTLQACRLTHESVRPRQLYLSIPPESRYAGTAANLQQALGTRLAMPVVLCDAAPPGLEFPDGVSPEALNSYAPALGAALEGLEACPSSFNFLHPSFARAGRRTRHFSWKLAAACFVLVLIAAAIFWNGQIQARQSRIDDLQRQINQTAPEEAILMEARENWNLLRSYVPPHQDGSRFAVIGVLHEISRLFPGTEDAYVTELIIEDRSGSSAGADVTIRGNARQSEVVTRFIEGLNASELFQEARRGGSITQDSPDSLYPFRFSVTCNRRVPGEATAP